MYKRPQRGESEEDLLKLQEEFFRDKAEKSLEPAARLAEKKDQSKIEPGEAQIEYDPPDQLSNTFEAIPSNVNLGGIVERIKEDDKRGPLIFSHSSKGFPLAKRRDMSVKSTRGSIFSQQLKKLKKDNVQGEASTSGIKDGSVKDDVRNFPLESYVLSGNASTSGIKKESVNGDVKNLPPESYILSGDEQHEIHKENIDVMSKMTEEEIMEEREKLMSTLDPAIVAFLKSKRYHASKMQVDDEADMERQNKVADTIKVEDMTTVSEVLAKPRAERWLHFDRLEISKLAWMKDVNMSKLKEKEGYEARFDFGGWLLPYTETEINEKNRILYHHGDEPDRPGYTLQELFQLCRSNIIQQKITALNTVANILSLETSGIYDGTMDIPIEQVFFVLRFCLDDNTPSVLNASIKAVRNMFYYPIDEACIDSLLGFGFGLVQPGLSAEEQDEEDDETVNDQQLAETNLVKCLIRTQILHRIRYIINTVKPTIEAATYCLELLIRLSRDSFRTVNLIYKCESLIESVISNFVPKSIKEDTVDFNYGVPLKQALKLLRILATRSEEIATEFVSRFGIMDSVLMYLSSEHFSTNTNGIQLQTECVHFWAVLINYGLALDHFILLQPILLKMLLYHIRTTNLDMSTTYTVQGHLAALLNLIAQVATKKFEYVLPYVSALAEQAVPKWTAQFSSLSSFLCGKLLTISALLHCLSCLVNNKPVSANWNLISVNNAVRNLINSKGFKVVTCNIENASNILSKYDTHKPCKNLMTMEAAVWRASEHIVPILQTNSCLPFLSNVSKYVEACEDRQLKLSFQQNENLQKYLLTIRTAKKYNLTANWFTKIESTLILNLLKTSVTIQRDIDTSMYYEIAVKCLSIFNSEQKTDIEFLLRNVIFNRNYYPSEVLMKNLGISERNETLSVCLNNLDQIFETYREVLNLAASSSDSKSDLCVDISLGSIIPIDWIYSPIIALYSKNQEKVSIPEEKLIFIVTNCLRWICIYETYFSTLASLINPTDKFCRLACVFLGSDDLFFVPEIHSLLQECLKRLLMNDGRDLDFGKPVHGLSNFQDFYTQLLEQYQGVSYSDVLFGNFILIPLMQKQDVRYRKLLWSEYAGVVQICNVTSEQLMCPFDMFLTPPETDQSLLKSYRKAAVMGMLPQNSALSAIARHHLSSFTNVKK